MRQIRTPNGAERSSVRGAVTNSPWYCPAYVGDEYHTTTEQRGDHRCTDCGVFVPEPYPHWYKPLSRPREARNMNRHIGPNVNGRL